MDNLWKDFGRETEAGKMLFNLYKAGEPAKINYPKPKTRKQPLKTTQEKKPCPQKTEIEYPEISNRPHRRYAPINFVPRRKNQQVIEDEMERDFRYVEEPIPKGGDRTAMVNNLQEKFQFAESSRALPGELAKGTSEYWG